MKKLLGILAILAISIPGLSAASSSSINTCFSDLNKSITECYKEINVELTKTKTDYQHNLINKSFTLDLGLSDLVFSSLKKSRDDFISKYIDKSITKIEKIRDENMRILNLQNAFGAYLPNQNTTLLAIEAVFGESDISQVIMDFKNAMKSKCQDKRQSKLDQCDTINTGAEKEECRSEANLILKNCFKTTGSIKILDNIQNKIKAIENRIIDKVNGQSFVKNDKFVSVVDMLRTKSNQFDESIKELNAITNMNFGRDLGDLSSGDPLTLTQSYIATKLGFSPNIVGAGAYSELDNTSPLNFKLSTTSKINNLCELTKCLIFPEHKKYTTTGTPTAGFQKCISAGYTKEMLSGVINNARNTLMLKLQAILLKEILIMLPIDEYIKAVKESVICSMSATYATLKGDGKDSENIGDTISSIGSIAGNMTDMVSGFSKAASSVVSCLSRKNSQAQKKETLSGKVKLGKQSGLIVNLQFAAFKINVPFLSALGLQVKGESESLLTDILASPTEIKACVTEGQSIEWQKNFDECKSNIFDFNLDFNISAQIPELTEMLRQNNRNKCLETQWDSGAINEYDLSHDKDSKRFLPEIVNAIKKFDDNLKFAIQELTLRKIKYTDFTPTDQGHCATRVLKILKTDNIYGDFFTCPLLDPDISQSASFIQTTDINITTIDEIATNCNDSAKKVIEELLQLGDQTIDETESESPGSIFNPRNSISSKTPSPDFALTRAISNVNICSEFKSIFINEYFQKLSPIPVNSIANERILEDKLKGIIGQNKDIDSYIETLEFLEKRSFPEKFNICIKNPLNNPFSTTTLSIYRANQDFCDDFKIALFDRYYNEASQDLNFPLIDQEARLMLDEYIKNKQNYYKRGE